MTTRRDFLKQTAVLAAGTFVIPTAVNFNFRTKPEVIIIGAGLSGLAAAYKLKKAGCKVTVLEARNRIGGRVFSFEFDKKEKLVIELGAEWVGRQHTRMIELADEFKLVLENNQFDTRLIYAGEYYPKGKWSLSKEWLAKWEDIKKIYLELPEEKQIELDNYDWWRYLVNNGISQRDLDIRDLLDSTDYGECSRFFSAFSGLAYYTFTSEKNEMDFKFKGGNNTLTDAFAEKIGRDNILINHKVSDISQADGGVTVTCDNSKTFSCDSVICTIPTFSVSKINWNPELPKHKIDAINELQYTRINKHAVLFENRFWEDESFDMVTDSYGHYFYHGTKNQKSRKGVLFSYTIGDKAEIIHKQTKTEQKNIIVNSLKPAFGDISSQIIDQVNYYWGNDPYSRGAYAIFKIGQWFRLRPPLAEKHLNVHFAGEHLAEWQGFMEGAVNTGEAASDMILG